MSQSFAEALNWVPVSATLSATLGRAHEYARAQAYRTVTLEHLLLALAEDPDAGQVMQASGIDVARMTADVSQHLGHSEDRLPDGENVDPAADEALIRILDYAAAAARQSKRREINGAIVLAAIVGEGHSVAASMLQAHGLTFEGAIKALQRSQPARQQLPTTPQPSQNPGVTPQPHAYAPPPQSSTQQQPSALPAPVIGISNGVAAQTNEQILANVRRRIDATRKQPKANSNASMPAREPYPAPPGAGPQPVAAKSEPPHVAVPPPSPQIVAPEPAPVVAQSGDMPMDVHVQPPQAPDVAPNLPDVEYAGLYPDPPHVEPVRTHERSAAPAPVEAVAEQQQVLESMGWEQPAAPPPVQAREPVNLPPPLPPAPAPVRTAPGDDLSRQLAEAPPSPLRPRQHGAPVAPPSSVAWPEPVVPQPNALPPRRPKPPAQSVDPYSYDGGIAGPPFPEPEWTPPSPPSGIPVPVQRTKVPKIQPKRPSSSIEPGQLVENIPRGMKVGKTETVEVRIAKSHVQSVADGMQGQAKSYLHELIVTKAMSVRLRAPDGGFAIETGSPETQWLDNNADITPDDFASWRWNVTPLRRGARQLQLIVSARTIASDGLTADTALPDQVFDVSVQANYAHVARQAAVWAGLMILGGVLSKFGQNGFETVATLWRGFE